MEGTRGEGWAGGFMVVAECVPPLGGEEEGGHGIMQLEEQPPTPEAKPTLSPRRAGPGSGSSSGGDSDADVRVTMVTARSVFENKPQGRGRRGVRGKNRRKR